METTGEASVGAWRGAVDENLGRPHAREGGEKAVPGGEIEREGGARGEDSRRTRATGGEEIIKGGEYATHGRRHRERDNQPEDDRQEVSQGASEAEEVAHAINHALRASGACRDDLVVQN